MAHALCKQPCPPALGPLTLLGCVLLPHSFYSGRCLQRKVLLRQQALALHTEFQAMGMRPSHSLFRGSSRCSCVRLASALLVAAEAPAGRAGCWGQHGRMQLEPPEIEAKVLAGRVRRPHSGRCGSAL